MLGGFGKSRIGLSCVVDERLERCFFCKSLAAFSMTRFRPLQFHAFLCSQKWVHQAGRWTCSMILEASKQQTCSATITHHPDGQCWSKKRVSIQGAPTMKEGH